jgi:hypothetical protein
MADDRESGEPPRPEPMPEQPGRPRPSRRPRERRPGSTVRLSSSTAETAIKKEIPSVQHFASRLSNHGTAASNASITLPARSKTTAIDLKWSETTRLILVAFGMLLTIVVCGFGMWYFTNRPANQNQHGSIEVPQTVQATGGTGRANP